MQIEKYKIYTAVDFLKDKDFLRWQLFEQEEEVAFWKKIIDEMPELERTINEAIILYEKNILINEYKLTKLEFYDSLLSLNKKIVNKKKKSRRSFVLRISAVAAAIAVFIMTLTLVYNKEPKVSEIDDFTNFLSENDDFNSSEIKLKISEDKIVYLANSESTIYYAKNEIKADDHIIKEETYSINQLIVPYGKRSTVTFSDGTKAWVNAGSKLAYPVEFSDGKREIYVEGEIYIEVAEEKNTPFIIRTKQMAIRVLGTKFNVNAHESDKINSVVLLSGSVSISQNSFGNNIILEPNQMYSTLGDSYSVDNVDASIYISWIEGVFEFESESLKNISKRLERYYGIKIECDIDIAEMKCSGKLDLKDDLTKLMAELSRALPIEFSKNIEGNYNIKTKK